jgi:hypothetical protein
MPALPDNLRLPADLREFYAQAGGATLFDGAKYPTKVVAPTEFVRASPVIYPGLPLSAYDEYPAKNWFIITNWRITIDLNPDRLGRCYDSFWDRHAMRGSSTVVALSFTDLIHRLIAEKGNEVFWTKLGFSPLGDAYDDVAQNPSN